MEPTQPILYPEYELPSGEAKEIVAPKTVDTKHRISAPKKGLKFYWREVRLIVLSLVILELLASVFSAGKITAGFGDGILSLLSFLAQITAFVFLCVKFLKEKSVKQSFLAPLFCAFLAGLFLAIIQLIWHHRVWTLYNLAFEPVWWLIRALFITIFINIIYKIYQLLIFKKEIEPTLKIT
jgi:hypothetical protein